MQLTRIQHLLVKLGEEGGEIAQMIGKTLIFGEEEIYHEQNLTNIERLEQEINDFLGVVKMLEEEGVFKNIGDKDAIAQKKEKVEKYYQYCVSIGKIKQI